VRRRLAWALVVLAASCAAAQTAVLSSFEPLLSRRVLLDGWPVVTLATVVGTHLGAVILSRRPRHPVGWILCLGQAATSVGLLAAAVGARAAAADPVRPADAGHLATWTGALLGNVGLALIPALCLLAPDGRLLSRRWRPVLVLSLAGLPLHVAANATAAPTDLDAAGRPLREDALTAVLGNAWTLVLLASLVAGAVSLAVRLRRSGGEARAQLLWVVAPASTLAAGALALVAAQAVMSAQGTWVDGGGVETLLYTLVYLGWAGLPVCAGIAVLRHRLFDIDVVVSRAVVLAVTTGFVAGAYVAVVVLLGGLLGGPAGGFWPSLSATAVAALAFQPLRRRVLRLADRLAYGRRAEPYQALADLTARLTRSPTPGQLLAVTAAAAGAALAAEHATATLHLAGAPPLAAGWTRHPEPRRGPLPGDTTVAVRDAGDVLGSITVGVPAGRDLRAAERRLLEDLADQAAPAFRNARLEAELAASVADLDRRTTELARSRGRLIAARDAERVLLEQAISSEVLPELADLPQRLTEAAGRLAAGGPEPDLSGLLTRTTEALERLRELSHGVFPVQLARSGLGSALRTLGGRADPPATVRIDPALQGRRHPDGVETALYLCARQAVRAVTGPLAVDLAGRSGELVLELRGPGAAGAATEAADRIEAVGGTLEVGEDGGLLRARVPAGQPADAAAQASASRSGPNDSFGRYAAAPQPSSSTSPSG
jgi:hypothetical protein